MNPRRILLALGGLLPAHSFHRLRKALYLAGGLPAGAGCHFMGRLRVHGDLAGKLAIGRDCVFNDGITLDLGGRVEIGDRVSIGMESLIATVNHRHDDPSFRGGERTYGDVRVGAGAWLGARVTLLPGVSVGEGVVVGAGAVVTRDLPPHHLCAGVPARPIRPLPGGPAGGGA